MPAAFRSFFVRIHEAFQKHRILRILRIPLLVLFVLFLLYLIVPRFLPTRTYLIMGMDNYGSLDDVGRSDAMMLVTVDNRHGKIRVFSLARDTLLTTSAYRETKVNTIVRQDGEDALSAAISEAFGVPISGWFRLNFSSLVSIIDRLQGVDVDLTEAEVQYINREAGYYPGYPLKEGVSRMNGAQSLCFARCRHLDNDLGRGQRQTRLMSAVVARTKRIGLISALSLFDEMNHAWRTSLHPAEEILLILRVLPLRRHAVERYSLPFEGTWKYGKSRQGVDGILADQEANAAQLRSLLDLH